MNKVERHRLIKQLVKKNHVGTQSEIQDYLESQGVTVTQATLSRDIRELGLFKLRDENHKLYYSLPKIISTPLGQTVRYYVQKVNRAGFMLVLHTNLGEADLLANIIDGQSDPNILGTIAGADTLLVICKDEDVAKMYESELI